jgi:hypothetical protein
MLSVEEIEPAAKYGGFDLPRGTIRFQVRSGGDETANFSIS